MAGERPRGGRRRGDGDIILIAWRDLPAQVNARVNGETGQYVLPRRFQKGIDRAAMVAGKKSASDYVAEWRRDPSPIGADAAGASAAAIARREGERIEAAFPIARIDAFVATGGWDPQRSGVHELISADVAARIAAGYPASEAPEPDDESEDD